MEISSEPEFTKDGKNFLGILNDLKRRPEDAAKELGVSEEEIRLIINGKKKQFLLKLLQRHKKSGLLKHLIFT